MPSEDVLLESDRSLRFRLEPNTYPLVVASLLLVVRPGAPTSVLAPSTSSASSTPTRIPPNDHRLN